MFSTAMADSDMRRGDTSCGRSRHSARGERI